MAFKTSTIGTDIPGSVYEADLQEWMRTRSPFTMDDSRAPRQLPEHLRYLRQPSGAPVVQTPDPGNRAELSRAVGRVTQPKAVDIDNPEAQTEDLERRTRILRAELRANPVESVPAWVLDFPRQEMILQSLVNRGKFAEARDFYGKLRQTVDDNYDELINLTTVGNLGVDGARVAELSKRLVNDEYLDTPVRMADGSATTMGALVRDGGQIAIQAARDEFDALGLPEGTAELLFNGSGQQRAVLKSLTQPLLSGQTIADRMQRVDYIDMVVNNWQALEETFGDGAAYMIQRMQDLHAGSGGAAAVLGTLLSVADQVKAARGLEGRELVREVCGAYTDMQATLFRKEDGTARSMTEVPAMERMLLDSVLSSTVQELGRRGVDVNLRDPGFMSAVADAMDMQAYAMGTGLDLVGVGRAAGQPLPRAMAAYVADSLTLDPDTRDQNNAVARLRSLRQRLDSSVLGGFDFSATAFQATGSAEDYLSSVARSVGGFSSSPGADALADGARRFLFRTIASKLPGRTLEDVLSDGLNDGSLVQGMAAQVFQPYLAGDGAIEAAARLAETVVANFVAGKPFRVQDAMFDLAYEPATTWDSAAVRETAANWYSGNVSEALRFAQPSQDLIAHYQVDEQLPAQKAAALASRVRTQAAAAERRGLDPERVYEDALAQGSMYVYDPTTIDPATRGPRRYNPLTGAEDPVNGLARVLRVVGDRRNEGWVYGAANSQFDLEQTRRKQDLDQWNEVVDVFRRSDTRLSAKEQHEE